MIWSVVGDQNDGRAGWKLRAAGQESPCLLSVVASPVNVKSISDGEKGLRNISPFVFERVGAPNPGFPSCSSPSLGSCLHVVTGSVYEGFRPSVWHPL